MIKISRVLILLSTYNGEKYLRQQLDSILYQESETLEVNILARDDGSADSTVQILKEYSKNHRITVIEGENVKPAQSFLKLLFSAEAGYDAYAFADQDDIWLGGKLDAALKALAPCKDTPTLWFCNIAYLDGGKTTPADICSIEKANSLEAIAETFATTNGCTMVFNEALLNAVKTCKAGQIDMHDSFVNALCIAVGGRAVKDDAVYVQYRLHEEQALGTGDFSVRANIKRFIHPNRLRRKTVNTLLTSDCIADEHKKYLTLLSKYRNPVNKIKIALMPKPEELTKKQHIKFLVQIFTNAY